MTFQKWQLRSKENRCAPTAFLRTPENLRNAALQLHPTGSRQMALLRARGAPQGFGVHFWARRRSCAAKVRRRGSGSRCPVAHRCT